MANKYGIIKFNSSIDSAGFFSNYLSVISTMIVCHRQNLLPYVDAANTWFNPTCNFESGIPSDPGINPWNWWFEQSIDFNAEAVGVPIDRGFISHNPGSFGNQPRLQFARSIADMYCKIQSSILEEENNLYEKYLKGKTSLGILARGTEMLFHHLEYPKVKLEDWPNLITRYLESYPDIDNIFLVSDDNEIIDVIQEEFKEVIYLKDVFRKTTQTLNQIQNCDSPWWLFSPTGDPNHRNRVGRECLIQTRLLAKCQYFLGTHSGISNGAQFFNNNTFKHIQIV